MSSNGKNSNEKANKEQVERCLKLVADPTARFNARNRLSKLPNGDSVIVVK